MSLSDRELWSAAYMVVTNHGDRAPMFVAERIGALVLSGDAEGVATWRAIAQRLDRLRLGDVPAAQVH
jgi:hypothetical protein